VTVHPKMKKKKNVFMLFQTSMTFSFIKYKYILGNLGFSPYNGS